VCSSMASALWNKSAFAPFFAVLPRRGCPVDDYLSSLDIALPDEWDSARFVAVPSQFSAFRFLAVLEQMMSSSPSSSALFRGYYSNWIVGVSEVSRFSPSPR